MKRFSTVAGLLAAGSLLLGACSGAGERVVGVGALGSKSADAVGDRNELYSLLPGVVNVCAFFPYLGDGDFSRAATFSASAPAGEDVLAGNFVIQPLPSCIEIWNASPTSPSSVSVSASLVASHPGYEIDRIATSVGDGIAPASFDNLFGVQSASVDVNAATGAYIWFKFRQVELPPPGGQGCTPGYWRQPHHFDSWTGYSPGDSFAAVFGVPRAGTLLQNVTANGGGDNALARHSVAALLNATSAGVNYDYTVAQVIAAVQAAFASGDRKVKEEQKNIFDFLNNQGCLLN